MRNRLKEYYTVVIISEHFGEVVEDQVTFDDYDSAIQFCDNHQVGQKFNDYTIVDIRIEVIHI